MPDQLPLTIIKVTKTTTTTANGMTVAYCMDVEEYNYTVEPLNKGHVAWRQYL